MRGRRWWKGAETGRGAQKTSLGEVTMKQRSERWEGGLRAGI